MLYLLSEYHKKLNYIISFLHLLLCGQVLYINNIFLLKYTIYFRVLKISIRYTRKMNFNKMKNIEEDIVKIKKKKIQQYLYTKNYLILIKLADPGFSI